MWSFALSLVFAAATPGVPAAAPATDSSSGRFASEEALRRYVAASWLERSGSLSEALAEYLRALSLDPGSNELLLRVSEVSAHLGQPERSLEFADRALSRDPGDARALWLRGAALFNMGRAAESLEPLGRAARADSSRAEYLRTLARVAESLERQDVAEDAYRRLVWIDETDGEAWFQLAAAEARRGDFRAADASIRRAGELNPLRPGSFFLQGWIDEGLGRDEDAIGQYRQHLAVHEADVTTRRRLVALLARQGKTAEAWALARQLAQAQPQDPELLQLEAELAFAAGHPDDGQRTLERMRGQDVNDPSLVARSVVVLVRHERGREATRLAETWRLAHPGDARGALLSARAYGSAGLADSALVRVRLAVAASPDSLEPRRLMARLLQDAGRFEDAEREWMAIRDRSPGDAAVLLDLGFCRERAGDLEGALQAGRDALRVSPNSAPALNFLGYMLADHDRELPQARRLIERALEQDPDNGAYLDSLGWVLFRLGQYQDARTLLERAVSRTGGDPAVHEHLGDLYLQMKLPQMAREQYRLCLAADAGNSRVKGKLREVR